MRYTHDIKWEKSENIFLENVETLQVKLIGRRAKLVGHESKKTRLGNMGPVSRPVHMNRITLTERVQFLLVEILLVESILLEIGDGVEGRLVVQSNLHPVVALEIVDGIADDFGRVVAQHLEGPAQPVGTDDGPLVGLVRPLHPSHKEFQEFVAAIKGHESVFDRRLAQDERVAGRVPQTVQRAQDNHVQVQVDAAVLVEQGNTQGVAQVLEGVVAAF